MKSVFTITANYSRKLERGDYDFKKPNNELEVFLHKIIP